LSKQWDKRNSLAAKEIIKVGLEFAKKGQLEKALAEFSNAVEMDRCQWEVYRFMGIAYAKLKQYELAIGNFNITIKHTPYNPDCFFERGITKMFSGQLASALEDFSTCVNLDPKYAPAYSSRAGILTRQGLYQEALGDIKVALSLKPHNPDYLHNRAVILTALEQYREAIQDYECIIKLNPKIAGSYNNLAWILATAKDPEFRDCKKAIFYARKALGIDKCASWLDTLAAAYAECGDFKQAVRTERLALKSSAPSNENFRKRIELYKMGKTYVAWKGNSKQLSQANS